MPNELVNLVKRGNPALVPIRLEAHTHLVDGVLCARELRQLAKSKVARLGGLDIPLEVPAHKRAQHEDLAHAVVVGKKLWNR